MSAKSKTTISIKTPVYEAAQALAGKEERDFSFVVERALIGELKAAGINVGNHGDAHAVVMSLAADLGIEEATNLLRAKLRTKKKTEKKAA